MTQIPPKSPRRKRDAVLSALRSIVNRHAARGPALSVDEPFPKVHGDFRLTARRVGDTSGKSDRVLVHDPNMVVSLGRRVMSRLIAGCTETPPLLRTQRIGLRIIRGTSGGVTSAWISFEHVTGTNEYLIQGHTDADSPEWSIQYTGGEYTLSTLATAISGQIGGDIWAADVVSGLGSTDAVNILPTPRGDCLGSETEYAEVPTSSPYTRRFPVYYTSEDVQPEDDVSALVVTSLRFGTQGHQPAATTLGKDVLASDEHLTSALRAIDLGYSVETDDILVCTITYPNTGQVQFETILGGSQGVDLELSEAALFTTGGYMVAKKTFGKLMKTDEFEFIATWTLLF